MQTFDDIYLVFKAIIDRAKIFALSIQAREALIASLGSCDRLLGN
jgi:hypothetical protein